MGKENLEKWMCENCQVVFYLRAKDVKTKASVEGIVCPFCVTYGDHVHRESVDFKIGDKVRHKDKPYYGTGIVQEISESGKRVYVRWGDDWDRRRLSEPPYGAYYRPDKLIRIS